MRVLLLGNQADSPEVDEAAYYGKLVDFFAQPVKRQDIQVNFTLFSDILFEITSHKATIYDSRNDCDFSDYDVVFIRGQFRRRQDFVYVISRYMQLHKKQVINDYSHLRTSSKLAQAYTFFELGMPSPDSLIGSKTVLMEHHSKLQMPFICKEVYGAHGHNNYLITSETQLEKVLASDPQGLYVLQPYIANDGDYRLLIIGPGQLIIKRSSVANSHLNNTSQGGAATLLNAETSLPAETVILARKYCDYLAMPIAGVDIMYSTKTAEYLFLEVNSQPQLVSGAFTTEKQALVAAYLADLASQVA